MYKYNVNNVNYYTPGVTDWENHYSNDIDCVRENHVSLQSMQTPSHDPHTLHFPEYPDITHYNGKGLATLDDSIQLDSFLLIFFICMFYQVLGVLHSSSSTLTWGSVLPSIVETRDQNSRGCPLLFSNRNLGSFCA